MLYCSAVATDEEHAVYALAFRADTGRLRWRRRLCSGELLAGSNRAIDLGAQVAVSAGKVYVLTPLGTLACLDAISGEVKWETAWQQTLEVQKLNPFGGQAMFPDNVPFPTPPIVYGNRVLIMPQGCNWIIGFDTDTGEPKWIRDRREEHADLHYLYGIATTEAVVRRKGVKYKEQIGMLIAAGRKIIAYNVSNGKAVWETDLSPYERAVGIGVVTEHYILAPTRTALVPVAVHDGTIPADSDATAAWHCYKWTEPKLEAGHVLINNGVLITASPNAFNVYYVKSVRQQQLLAEMKKTGETPALWMQVADLDDRTFDYDKALASLDKAHNLAATWAALPETDPKHDTGMEALEESGHRIAEINFKAGLKSLGPIEADDAAVAGGTAAKLSADDRAKLAHAAQDRFDTALAMLKTMQHPSNDDAARATWGRARALETLATADKNATPALLAFHELLSAYPDVKYTFGDDGKTEYRAAEYADGRIADLIRTYGRASYAPIEAEAVKLYQAETAKPVDQQQPEDLDPLINGFPNAEAAGDALLLKANILVRTKGALQATGPLNTFLRLHGDSPKAAEVEYQLYTLYSGIKHFSAAKIAVLGLKTHYIDQKIQVDGKETAVAGLVADLLKLPELQPAPSIIQRKHLTATPLEGWPLQMANQGPLYALATESDPPRGCEKFLYVTDLHNVYCIEGSTGARRFSQKVLMTGRTGQTAFAGNALVTVTGSDTITGQNAAGGGEAWDYTFEIKGQKYNVSEVIGSETLALVVDQRTMALAGVEPTSGRELWSRTDIKGQLGEMQPTVVDDRVVVVTVDNGEATVHLLDAQTGQNLAPAYKLDAQGVQHTTANGTTLVVQDRNNMLIGYELFSGKLLWKTQLAGPVANAPPNWVFGTPRMLFTTDKYVVAVRQGAVDVLTLSDGKPTVKGDSPSIDVGGQVTSVVADGDQLMLQVNDAQNPGRPHICAYSLATGAEQWKTPSCFNIPLSAAQVTSDYVLTAAQDFKNGVAFKIDLVDRKTGKIMYTAAQRNNQPLCMTTCDGAFLVGDQMQGHGYVCVDPDVVKKRLAAAEATWKADPKNMTSLLAYVDDLALLGQDEKAYGLVVNAFNQGMVTPDNWMAFVAKLEAVRRTVLETHKFKFLVQKTAKAPTIDGKIDDWKDAVWFDFKDIRYIYHDTLDKALAKTFWKTPDDLSCKTAMKYDKDNLYVCWVVTDDIQDQTKTGPSIWDGDSVQFAVDPNNDGGTSWRQGDTEDTLALDAATGNSMVAIDYSPTQKNPEFKATRDEKTHQTIYEMSIPLSDLGLTVKEGGHFGYTFIVNDRDDDKASLNKGLAPSPGIWNPKTPGLYSHAYFGKDGQTELTDEQKKDDAAPAADQDKDAGN
ncbi:MAG: PQQ-binding-like beta-propeller repeat protein, partial [Planctomycetota bacterium]